MALTNNHSLLIPQIDKLAGQMSDMPAPGDENGSIPSKTRQNNSIESIRTDWTPVEEAHGDYLISRRRFAYYSTLGRAHVRASVIAQIDDAIQKLAIQKTELLSVVQEDIDALCGTLAEEMEARRLKFLTLRREVINKRRAATLEKKARKAGRVYAPKVTTKRGPTEEELQTMSAASGLPIEQLRQILNK
jgi:RNA-binding protein YhbY